MHKKIEHKKLDFDENVRLNNIDVWKTVPEFNYDNWDEETQARLVRVKWDSNYEHTVDWSINDRDAYLNALPGYSLTDLHNLKFTTTTTDIKVAIPMQNVVDYNYLIVDDQREPVSGSVGRRLLFFVIDVIQLAPDAIQLILQLDLWSTYMVNTDVKQVNLVRGHYGVNAITPEQFLANPLNGGLRLSGIETVNGDITKIRKVMNSPIGNGGYPAFYASASPNDNTHGTGPIWWTLVDGPGLSDFSDWTSQNCPEWYSNIIQIATIPADCIDVNGSGVQVMCGPHKLMDWASNAKNAQWWGASVTKADFGYDSRFANITKLYTKQYALWDLQLRQMDAGDFAAQGALEDWGNSIGVQEKGHTYTTDNNNPFQMGCRVDTAKHQFLSTWAMGRDDISITEGLYKNAMEAAQKAAAHQSVNATYTSSINAIDEKTTINNLSQDRYAADNNSQIGFINQATALQLDKARKMVTSVNDLNSQQTALAQGIDEMKGLASVGSSLVQGATSANAGALLGSIGSSVSTGLSVGIGIFAQGQFASNQNANNSYNYNSIERPYQAGQAANTQQNITDNTTHGATFTAGQNSAINNYERASASAIAGAGHAQVDAPYTDAMKHNMTMPNGTGAQVDTYRMEKPSNVKLITATDEVIERAGREMLRYGYMGEIIVDNPTLSITPKYTYWLAQDVMLNNRHNETVNNGLKAVFRAGTTVYRNPDDCQTVSEIDNKW